MHQPLRTTLLLALGLSTLGSAFATIPACADAVTPTVVLQDQGMLEAVIVDPEGRLLLSNISKKAVQRLARRDEQPTILFSDITGPGGLALGDQNDLYVGAGGNLSAFVPSTGKASILRFDLATGARQTYATGLSMSNGVRRGADGTMYASNDLAKSLDRVLPNGQVQTTWLKQNSNGMSFSADGQTLFFNQTFPAKVMAVDLRTNQVRVHAQPTDAIDGLAVFDGMTIDAQGNLFVAAYLQGKVLRVSPAGVMCAVASGLSAPSDMAIGTGLNGFTAGNLYVTSHSGRLYELPGVAR
jgi:sugar lactone lactonase YvrE